MKQATQPFFRGNEVPRHRAANLAGLCSLVVPLYCYCLEMEIHIHPDPFKKFDKSDLRNS